MNFTFAGDVIEWRGPAPYLFVRVPEDVADVIGAAAAALTYGWGCIPARGRIGGTPFTTALFPKDGGYLVPVKVAVQRAEGVAEGMVVDVELELGEP